MTSMIVSMSQMTTGVIAFLALINWVSSLGDGRGAQR